MVCKDKDLVVMSQHLLSYFFIYWFAVSYNKNNVSLLSANLFCTRAKWGIQENIIRLID